MTALDAPRTDPRTEPGEARRPRIPLTLRWLLAATFVLALAWALVTPIFQAPDESAHFGYVQSLADGPGLPGAGDRPLFSSEQYLAGSSSNSDQVAQQPTVKMEWSAEAYERWKSQDAARDDGGGPNPATSNPPLYYLYEAVVYKAFGDTNIFDRLVALRLASAMWLLVTVIGVWLLAGEITGRDRLLQLAAGSVAGLAPMMSFLSASVTPDAMMIALWSLVLWLGVRALKHGLTWRDALLLFALTGAACCVKSTSYALIPGALLVLAVALVRAKGVRLPTIARVAGSAAIGLALTIGVWKLIATATDRATSAQLSAATSTSGVSPRMLVSYLWQFYLPSLPFQDFHPFAGMPLPLDELWLRRGWGAFGWLEVRYPPLIYQILLGVTALAVTGAGVTVWRARNRLDWAVAAFLALVTVALLAGLHWTEFQQLSRGGGAINQGRYLLPLAGIAGLVVAQALRVLPVRARPYGVGVLTGGLLALQLLALGLMMDRYFA